LFGGQDGLGARLTVNPGTANEAEWPSKVSGRKVSAGDVIRVMGPSSAGYGDPRERDPARVLADWLDDIIDADEAASQYGVVIDTRSGTVDEAATAALRKGRPA
jgi:N-methylhydantoinase B/oxoprolinase/acetone carboxylase alpha subunit